MSSDNAIALSEFGKQSRASHRGRSATVDCDRAADSRFVDPEPRVATATQGCR